MTGAARQSRQTPEPRKALRAQHAAERSIIGTQLAAEAAQARAMGLALLASEFAAKMADVQQNTRGPELAAKLDALMRERTAAERALLARLAAEALARRKAVLGSLTPAGRRGQLRASYKAAAAEAAAPRTSPPPARPRERARGTRAPKLRR